MPWPRRWKRRQPGAKGWPGMSMGHGSQVGYNVQVAVEAKHSLIIATEVTQRQATWVPSGRWPAGAGSLGRERLSVVADKGYYNGKEVLLCEEIGVTAYVAKP